MLTGRDRRLAHAVARLRNCQGRARTAQKWRNHYSMEILIAYNESRVCRQVLHLPPGVPMNDNRGCVRCFDELLETAELGKNAGEVRGLALAKLRVVQA